MKLPITYIEIGSDDGAGWSTKKSRSDVLIRRHAGWNPHSSANNRYNTYADITRASLLRCQRLQLALLDRAMVAIKYQS